jgi:predicted Fe-Mo cluster-binding NifX family protein
MRVAIPVETKEGENSVVCEHFGRTPYFAYVDIDENGNYSVTVEENPLIEHTEGALPELLKNKGVDLIVAFRMGQKAQAFFNQWGIKVVLGAHGRVADVIRELKEVVG